MVDLWTSSNLFLLGDDPVLLIVLVFVSEPNTSGLNGHFMCMIHSGSTCSN